ncbi:dihydrofolate reductase family protein [Dactylosporangium sp. NPDC051484]|uniref:dihydrofolate reductase family protein n=1 Tax=Dactylosporangium sp. NPDC051484 TaxID=3154942 RepID=UPI00344F1B5F
MPDVPTALREARAAAGDRYVNVLGADIARQCLDAGELDEVLAMIAPVLLGDGTRLFDHPGGAEVRMEQLYVSRTPKAINAWMRIIKQPQSR